MSILFLIYLRLFLKKKIETCSCLRTRFFAAGKKKLYLEQTLHIKKIDLLDTLFTMNLQKSVRRLLDICVFGIQLHSSGHFFPTKAEFKKIIQFRRRTFHEPNLIPWIKYMKSSASESVKNGYLNLERLSRSFRLPQPGISRLERLYFRRRTFHVPNLMHKLL